MRGLGTLSPNRGFYQVPHLRAQGTLRKRRQKESKREWRTPKNHGLLGTTVWCTYELTETEATRTGPAPDGVVELRGGVDTSPRPSPRS